MTRNLRRHLWLLIPALLMCTWLGARGLNMDMLWLDEYFSVGNVGGILRVPYNPVEVWVSVSQYSPQHPPGYFFLLSGWVALTGWSPFAMRALSLLLALLTVAFTYRLGREWLSPRAGLYAALTLSVSAVMIFFAHELRMYTLMALLTVFTLWAYRRVVITGRTLKRWEWAGLFFGAMGLMWVHYVSPIPLAAIGLYHLLFVPKNRRWVSVTVLLALAGLTFLTWVNVLLVGARFINVEEDTGVAVLGPAGVLRLLAYLFGNGNLGLTLVTAGAAALALRQRRARELWFVVLAVVVLTLVINIVKPMINENRPRYLITLWPLLALVVGLGLTELERRRVRLIAMGLLSAWLVLGIYRTLDPQFLADTDGPRYVNLMPPLREIIADVNQLGSRDDMVVGFSREQYLFNEVKFGPIAEFYLRDLRMANHFVTLPDDRPPETIQNDLRDGIGTRLNVWFAYEPVIAPVTLQPYRDGLEANYILCDTPIQEPDLRIDHYALAPFGCLGDDAPNTTVAAFDAGIRLAEVRLASDGHGGLLVASGWSVADSVPPETYSVSLKLWNSAGDFVAQADDGLRGAGFGWQLAKIAVDDVSAGDYTLTATVYDWRSGATLTGHAGDVDGEIAPVASLSLPFDS